MFKKIFILFLNSCVPIYLMAQQSDSLTTRKSVQHINQSHAFFLCTKTANNKPCIKSFIIPVTLITYGFIGLGNNSIKKINISTKAELTEDHPGFKTITDNYLQYSPAVAVYALNAFNIKGRNNFRDRTMIYAISTIISTSTVQALKTITKVERPDGSGSNSFPSGHTTTAFAAAEFLRTEYKGVSPFYGIAGYITATATGILRLYNNKHWVNDIVTGAGFGILSTKLAYWIYPVIKKRLFKDKKMNTMVMPYYQPGSGGISFVHNFQQ